MGVSHTPLKCAASVKGGIAFSTKELIHIISLEPISKKRAPKSIHYFSVVSLWMNVIGTFWRENVEYWIHLEWNKHRCMYVHFNDLFHMLKNWKYIVAHAAQVDDDLGMRWYYGIGLYTLVWIERRRHEITLRCLSQQKVTIALGRNSNS